MLSYHRETMPQGALVLAKSGKMGLETMWCQLTA